jgi:mannose-6-phosphate isomerase-like protein (cupin superfamily)
MNDIALGRGLPGGVAVSRLRVYDWPDSDGVMGGSPHLHTASTEGYVVLAGHGSVQTLSTQGLAVTELVPGTLAWFTPGTVHRLVNGDGALEILTVMSNAGLPEAGDAVLTFPAGILTDPDEYTRHAALPAAGAPHELAGAALRRRDLALSGFAELCERAATDLDATLSGLYTSASALVADRTESWRRIVASGPAAQVEATAQQLVQLAAGLTGGMVDSGIRSALARPGERYGMCGMLTVWEVDA